MIHIIYKRFINPEVVKNMERKAVSYTVAQNINCLLEATCSNEKINVNLNFHQ